MRVEQLAGVPLQSNPDDPRYLAAYEKMTQQRLTAGEIATPLPDWLDASLSAIAKIRAAVVFPTPRGPVSR